MCDFLEGEGRLGREESTDLGKGGDKRKLLSTNAYGSGFRIACPRQTRFQAITASPTIDKLKTRMLALAF
jgi:hypothetical protein